MRYILLFLLISCGRTPLNDFLRIRKDNVKRSKTDQTFKSYIKSFEDKSDLIVLVPVIFKNISEKYAGLCVVYSNGYREIQINDKLWVDYNEEQREALIFHELGHCVMNKGHDDSLMVHNKACPNSIMRSYIFNTYEIDNCYKPEYNHYVENIITRR